MRLAIAQPCAGSRLMAFRINRSRVPCRRSDGFGMDTLTIYNHTRLSEIVKLADWSRPGALVSRSMKDGVSLRHDCGGQRSPANRESVFSPTRRRVYRKGRNSFISGVATARRRSHSAHPREGLREG